LASLNFGHMVAKGNQPATERWTGGLAGRSRAAAAGLLLAGWYLLAALLVTGCGWLLAAGLIAAQRPGAHASHRYGAIALGLVCTWLAGSIGYSVIRTARRAPGPVGGAISLSRKQAPVLWRTTEMLAGHLGTQPPGEIYLTAAASVSVTGRARWLGLMAGPGVLRVGAAQLFGLSAPELQALLCHELGRHAAGLAGTPALVHRGHAALRAARQRPGDARQWLGGPARPARPGRTRLARWAGGPGRLLLGGYAALYTRAFRCSLRRQERAADAAAARLAGTQTLIAALAAAEIARLGWQDFITTTLGSGGAGNPWPDDPFRAYQDIFVAPGYRAGCPDAAAAQLLRPAQDGPQSSLARCIEALQHAPSQPPILDRAPGAKLRDPVRRLLPQLTGQLYAALGGPGPAGTVPWQRWLPDTACRLAGQQSAPLQKTASELATWATLPQAQAQTQAQDRPGAALVTVLDLLDASYGPELEKRLAVSTGHRPPEGTGWHQSAARLAAGIVTLSGHDLVSAGTASWAIDWSGTAALRGAPVSLEHLTALALGAIHHPAGVPALRAQLTAIGIGAPPPTARSRRTKPPRTKPPTAKPSVTEPAGPTAPGPRAATASARRAPSPRKQRASR
jgi:Zn-dependent protease with chaperone function